MSFSMSEWSKLDLCYMCDNISKTVHAMTNLCMKDIYKVIYDLLFTL